MIALLALNFTSLLAAGQQKWLGKLLRNDSIEIPIRFESLKEEGKQVWSITNGKEKIKVDNINITGDSLLVQMPVFESQFRVKVDRSILRGLWLKGGAVKTTVLPFYAEPAKAIQLKKSVYNISGKWAVNFSKAKEGELSVGIFKQVGNKLTGTFLNPTGDYRFLEGTVNGDSLKLSGFDGSHAYYFTAKIKNNKTITGGMFYSSATYKEEWTALKNAAAKVPQGSVAMFVKPGEENFHFTFKNLEGKPVSLSDEQFKNKVVVIQLMGSWCPNCMDETAFLSDYYNKNKQRGIEVIALAYEYSTDWERSIKSLKKFQQRYDVQYTILNTEVAVNDSLRTEKTLPAVTPIRFFPSSIIIDKKGMIRNIDTGFNGPATGEHYLIYKKEFEETINKLLLEN